MIKWPRLHYERLPGEPAPKVVKIPVRQLGLATGRVVVVRRKRVA